MRKQEQPKQSEEYRKFRGLAQKLIAVPKKEVYREKAAYEREKEGKTKRPVE